MPGSSEVPSGDLVFVPAANVEVLAVARLRDVPELLRTLRRRAEVHAYRLNVAESRRGPWVFGAAHLGELAQQARWGIAPDVIAERVRSTAAAVRATPGVRPAHPAYEEESGAVWVPREQLSPGIGVEHRIRPKSPFPRRMRGRAGESLRRAEDFALRGLEELAIDRSLEKRLDVPQPAAEEPPGPPPSRSPRRPLTRTPHIELDAEPPFAPSRAFTFEVFCDDQPADPSQRVTPVEIELPEGAEEVAVDVWVDGAPHVAIDGPARRSLVLRGDVAASARLSFSARVIDDPPPGDATIRAVFQYDGRPRGRVEARVPLQRRLSDAVPLPPPDAGPRREPVVRVTRGDRRPDVTVTVLKTGVPGQHTVTVTAPGVEGFEHPEPIRWLLPMDAPTLVAERFRTFAEPDLTATERRSRLTGAGIELWRDVPKRFAELYWQLADDRRQIGSLLVASQEPAFPWEMVVPYRGRGAQREVHAPLGVTTAIGRYLDEDLVSPEQDLVLDTSWILAPQYTTKPLPHAAEEAAFVCSSFGGECIDPSSFDSIEAAFGERAVPLIHMACHGTSEPGASHAVLLDDDVPLLSAQIVAMDRLGAAVASREPMVFINACEVGRTTPDLLGVGGFAVNFLELGARCVIAPLWKVEDTVAHELAMEFYGRLAADPPEAPAAILQRLRAKAYEDGGADSWAAYSFFGDPRAELGA